MSTEPIYCLLVDDDNFIVDLVKEALEHLDMYIITASNGNEAIDALASNSLVDILITDLNMPSMSGEDLIQKIRQISPRTIILVITGYATIPSAVSLLKQGIFEYLTKPFEIKNLLGAVERAIAEVKNRRFQQTKKDIRQIWHIGQFLDQNLTPNNLLQEIIETALKITEANGIALWLSLGENQWEEAKEINFHKESAIKIIKEEVENKLENWKNLTQEEITGSSLLSISDELNQVLVIPFLEENKIVAILLLQLSKKRISRHIPGLISVYCSQLAPIVTMSARIIRLLRSHEKSIQAQSALEKAHEELKQSSKLATIGELAAGIIHDINTPLTCIIGFLQLYMRFLDKPNVTLPELFNAREYLQHALNESQRCQQIVHDLLLFSRKESKAFQLFDLRDILQRINKIVGEQFRQANIPILEKIPESLPKIMGNANQIQQVLLNLMMNAKNAISPNTGIIEIVAESAERSRVKIIVKDTGKGISPENLSKIFQPFFTTNAPGQGTGLGLSISKKIIVEHAGEIYVESELGKSTTFTIFLPTH